MFDLFSLIFFSNFCLFYASVFANCYDRISAISFYKSVNVLHSYYWNLKNALIQLPSRIQTIFCNFQANKSIWQIKFAGILEIFEHQFLEIKFYSWHCIDLHEIISTHDYAQGHENLSSALLFIESDIPVEKISTFRLLNSPFGYDRMLYSNKLEYVGKIKSKIENKITNSFYQIYNLRTQNLILNI